MGRTADLTKLARAGVPLTVATSVILAGCSVFGGGPGSEATTPASPPSAEQDVSTDDGRATELGATPAAPVRSIEERLLAEDYEGVLAIYAADTALHYDESATYRAALAAAVSGHPAHDTARATRLLHRLLERHPDTERRFEVEVYLDVLAREREQAATIRRLDSELQQLKAIDLGRAPAGANGRP